MRGGFLSEKETIVETAISRNSIAGSHGVICTSGRSMGG